MSAPAHPKWRRLPEERPAQIVEAALEVFASRGLAAARLEDIARAAGVAKATIYLYFPNKEALFREVIRQTVVSHIESSERDFESATGPARDAFVQHLQRYWTFIQSPKFSPLFRLIHAEISQHPDLAKFYADEVVTRSHRLIAAIIKRGIDQGEFRDVDPLVTARMVSAPFVLHGLWCRHREAFTWMNRKTDEQVLGDLIDFNLAALGAHSNDKPAARGSKK
jgi:AcrR family transcriptional regulator